MSDAFELCDPGVEECTAEEKSLENVIGTVTL